MITLTYILSQLKKYEVVTSSIIACLFLLFLSSIFIKPNLEKLTYIISQKKVLENKNTILKNKEEILSSLALQEYKKNFNKMSQILPDNKDYVSLFSTFDSLEKQSGVSVTKTSFQLGSVSTTSGKLVKKPGTAAFSVPLSFNIVGDYSSVQNFITLVKSLTGRLINIEKINLTNKEDGSIQLTIDGEAYFYPYPSTIGSISSSLPPLDKKQEELLSQISQIEITPAQQDDSNIELGKRNLFQ